MTPCLTAIAVVLAAPCPELPTELWQVAPDGGGKPWTASNQPPSKSRAVVLIPGLFIHPLRPALAARPDRRDWMEPKSDLVKTLAKDFDVYSFGYAQTVPLEEVVQSPGLRDAVARLRKAGYKDIVLVGHSAGGLIAKQFVELYPDAGVTKVVAVASPFAGSELATLKVGYPKIQAPFVQSLTPEARAEATRQNTRAVGKDVEIVCVVCKIKRVETDGLVFIRSQWPDDLQQLGVPAVLCPINHFEVMLNAGSVKTVAELAREKLTRWSADEVEKARKVLYGEPMTRPNGLRRR